PRDRRGTDRTREVGSPRANRERRASRPLPCARSGGGAGGTGSPRVPPCRLRKRPRGGRGGRRRGGGGGGWAQGLHDCRLVDCVSDRAADVDVVEGWGGDVHIHREEGVHLIDE